MPKVGSKILFKKPTPGVIEFPEGLQAEVGGLLIDKFTKAVFPLPMGLPEDLEDPRFVTVYLEECIDEELRDHLMETDLGKGWLYGFLCGNYIQQQLEVEIDEEA
jgi:hypothetical protein